MADHDLLRERVSDVVALELEAAEQEAINTSFRAGVEIGYSLYSTWPTDPDDFPDWVAHALARAGLLPITGPATLTDREV